jgi:O-antigen/teichoic acid export membrane protein
MDKRVLIKNSGIGLLQYVLTAVIALVSVPVFIHRLGLELYGSFALVSVIGNLGLLTNLGLNSSLLVHISRQGKCRESDHDIVGTQIILSVIISLFIILTVVFRGPIIRNLFSVPEQHVAEAMKLLIYLVFANAFLLLGQTFSAIIDALQKIYLTNISQFVYSIIYWGGMILAVSMGGGLVSLGLIALFSSIVWFLLLFFVSGYYWGKLDLIGFKGHFFEVLRKQISYGSKIYLSGLAGFMFEPLSKILLSNFIGINSVALFEIGLKIKSQVSGLIAKAVYPFFPFIANSEDNNILKKRVFDLSKKIQILVIPASIVLGFILTILVKLWIGGENLYQTSLFVTVMTVTVILFSSPILPVYHYMFAKDMADKNIWIQLYSVVVNLLVFFVLYKKIGLFTILVSNTLGFFASYAMGNYYHYKYLGAAFIEEWHLYLKIICFGIVCSAVCLGIRLTIQVSLWDIIIYPVFVSASFVLYVRWLKLISTRDLEQYFGTMPVFKNSLVRILIA